MSMQRPPASRACQPCRSAKVKCDLARPVCGRCARRNANCFGYSDEVIRDQSAATAARVERQARRQTRGGSVQPGRDPTPSAAPFMYTEDDSELPIEAPWLKREFVLQIPRNNSGDSDSRAVDYFFTNWIMWPCSHHISPGHLQDLPFLYESSLPGTAIRLATEALAYGDLPSYYTKALTKYGHALGRVREVIDDSERCKQDSVLLTLLLIDAFELMHMDRQEPLGRHSAGLIHLLRARGDSQLLNKRSFALWRIAHHRLQARQLLLKEAPEPEQERWVHSLDVDQPDTHIINHVYDISQQNAQAHQLLSQTNISDEEAAIQVKSFFNKVHDITTDCHDWTENVATSWIPRLLPFDPPDALPNLLPEVTIHHDIWLAYMWNFHYSSSIIMREGVIDMLTGPLAKWAPYDAATTQKTIDTATQVIQNWSASLLRTMPQLLGLVDFEGKPRTSERDLTGQKVGKGLGGFFAFYALWVIRDCKHTPVEHRMVADQLLDWIHQRNSRA